MQHIGVALALIKMNWVQVSQWAYMVLILLGQEEI